MIDPIYPVSIVEDNVNIFGAAIFWLYIAAALCFSTSVIYTIANIRPAQDEKDNRRKEDVIIFSSLATISFGTLSSNMLNVLVQSYRSWSEQRGLAASLDAAQIWRWSMTSTLFQDFAEALVKTEEGYLWVQTALFATMSVCVFMASAGRQRHVPRLELFFCLSQILPISFTLNLFYVALSRLPDRSHQARISYGILPSIGAYCLCVLFAPWTAGGLWLLVTILMARVLLFSPLLLAEEDSSSGKTSQYQFSGAEEAQSMIGVAVYVFTAHQGYRVLAGRAKTTSLLGLFEHPAVSSLGCDLILCVASYLIWTWRSRSKAAPSKPVAK